MIQKVIGPTTYILMYTQISSQTISEKNTFFVVILFHLMPSALVKTFSSDIVDGPITSVKLFTASSNPRSRLCMSVCLFVIMDSDVCR